MPNRPGNDDQTTSNGGPDMGSQGSTPARRSNRGFASMDREKQKEIASKGGRAAHAKGTAHEFDSGEARDAGRKGGVAVSRNREHMAAIGRRGGEARGHARNRAAAAQTNSGSPTGEGAFPNSRNERQVPLNDTGVTANPQGARGINNPLG